VARNHRSLQGVLTKNYEAGKAYPGVLGFGGGSQTMNVVDRVIARNFRDEAEKRGYIVVVPAAPNDQLFFEGGERIFPELSRFWPTIKSRTISSISLGRRTAVLPRFTWPR
jgi:hypothetical protein